MKIDFKKDYKLEYSLLDRKLKLKQFEVFNFAQNTATEYFKMFNGDNISVRKNDNAVWVVTKARVHFYKNSTWLDTMEAHSYTTKIKPIRVETETSFKDKEGNLLFVATQQSCPLDIETRKIRKVSTVTYPENMEADESLLPDDYMRLNAEFEKEDFAYRQKIYSQDIDYSNHVNNSIYIRYIMNALTNDFIDKINITDFEIHYIAESKEGQVLNVYKKETAENNIEFLIKESDREIIRANIKYEKI